MSQSTIAMVRNPGIYLIDFPSTKTAAAGPSAAGAAPPQPKLTMTPLQVTRLLMYRNFGDVEMDGDIDQADKKAGSELSVALLGLTGKTSITEAQLGQFLTKRAGADKKFNQAELVALERAIQKHVPAPPPPPAPTVAELAGELMGLNADNRGASKDVIDAADGVAVPELKPVIDGLLKLARAKGVITASDKNLDAAEAAKLVKAFDTTTGEKGTPGPDNKLHTPDFTRFMQALEAAMGAGVTPLAPVDKPLPGVAPESEATAAE